MLISPLVIDVILGCVILFFSVMGWKYGFVKTVGSLFGLVISVVAGIWGMNFIGSMFGIDYTSHPIWIIIGFLVLTLIVSALLGWVVGLLDLARRVLSILPFVGLLNSFFGLIVGVLQGAVVVCALVYVAHLFFLSSSFYTISLSGSYLFSYALRALLLTGLL